MPGHPPGFFDATEMPTADWWEALWPALHEIVTAVGISPDMEVVDLCSGDGWFILQIAKRAHYVVAIDIEPKLLETARHRLAENNVTNCSFVTRNAYDLLKLLGRVEMWRGSCRSNISVSAPFVWRCLSGLTMTPFPHPAHRTGQADFPHPALGQNFTPSPTARCAQAGTCARARSARKGAGVDSSRPCVA
jgi:SAM-dependent methyltransferase